MNILRVLVIVTIISFLSTFYPSFEDKTATNSCFSGQSSMYVFEPITFAETDSFLYAHSEGAKQMWMSF